MSHRPRTQGRRVSAPSAAFRALAALATAALLVVGCGAPTPPAPEAGVRWVGAYVPSGVWRDLEGLRELEGRVGRPFDIAHWFTSWDHAYDAEPVEALLAAGRVPLISWQPHRQDLHDIAAGHHDDYLRSWAQGIRTAPGTVYLRPFPEMNGDWVPWNGDPTALRQAWTHLTTLFDHEGAHNVRWVWSPNVTDEPRTDTNRMEHYYPGHDHVDVLALSGYNWGDTRPYIGWRSFEEIVAVAYDRIAALGPQPLWVAETASSEEGGDKATWIREAFATTAFPRLEAIVWFNERKEADWRLESSRGALHAFVRAMESLAAGRRPAGR